MKGVKWSEILHLRQAGWSVMATLSSILRGCIVGKALLCIMQIRRIFAANLRKYRTAAGFSQEELAHRADIDRTYVSALERGVYSATIDMVARLAEVLEVEPSDMLVRSRTRR